MKTIYHDPYARHEIVRVSVHADRETCANCGNGKKTRTGKQYLYRYGTIRDSDLSASVAWNRGKFCSIDCFREYTR